LVIIKNDVCAGGILKRIEAVLRHFTLEQLVDIVPDFQILSWQNVRRKIIQEELPLNKNSVIRVLVFAVKVIHMEHAFDSAFSVPVLPVLQALNTRVF
jgi:hypothetical protein